MTITLNGEPHDLPAELTVTELLTRLQIDPRRVAVELNLTVLKRATFDSTVVREGDQVEIVNFVGGGACPPSLPPSLARMRRELRRAGAFSRASAMREYHCE